MLKELYPEITEFDSFFLDTNTEHQVYVEQTGNPRGIPIIFLHGGPGSGCNANHRRYFNPDKYRIILFDQRGCNRSLPNGSVTHNSTSELLSDIDAIRERLNLEKLILFGGSWGATLALLYAELYPKNVSGIILRGSFLARKKDLSWFVGEGVNRIYPDYWQEFLSIFSDNEKKDLVGSMYKNIFSTDKDTQLIAAKAWSLWAGRVVTHSFDEEYQLDKDEDEDKLINDVKIEIHYAKNNYFIKEDQIVKNIKKIPNVPIRIIHGRHDITCLPEASSYLYHKLPNSKLILVPNAGHLAGEPKITDALINATNELATLINVK
ncbi:MAG: prolyl aminopeptidase [Gammaproteobacteria bacterium]